MIAAVMLNVVLAASVAILLLRPRHPVQADPFVRPYAVFVATDTATRGMWRVHYGHTGYAIAGGGERFPDFAHIGMPESNHLWKWIDAVDELRALQKPNSNTRVAATWFGWEPFTIDVNLTDAKPHRLAAYLVDWDSTSRVENVELLDGINGQVLDVRQVSGFSDGQYLVWKVRGHVCVRIAPVSLTNAIINGLFLD